MLQTTHSDDPNVQEKIDKLTKRDRKTEQFFRWALKIMEWIIAGITLIALVGALGIEVVNMVTEGTAYFADVSHMLHNLLSIVVGLEFVRMLIDTRQHSGGADRGHYPPRNPEPRRPLEQRGLHRLHRGAVRHSPLPGAPQRAASGNGGL